jgi:L,D-transpeptidase YcbB
MKDQSSVTITPQRKLLIDTTLIAGLQLNMPATVRHLYHQRGLTPIWFDSGKLTPAADSLVAIIQNSDRHGLIPSDYHARLIEEALRDTVNEISKVRCELFLTDSYFTLPHHIGTGRLEAGTFVRKDLTDTVDLAGIESISGNRIFIAKNILRHEPKHLQYRALKDSLQLLLTTGIRDSTDSVKVKRIELSMERWRLKPALPDRYIRVNLPSFHLRVIEKDSVMLMSKVIVGKPETPSPIIESVVTSFIIYPYWHVPRSIATRELLPKIKNDSTYLLTHNYEILASTGEVVDATTIDWKSLGENNFPYTLRQREGKENTLGIIKFIFHNNYGVYLHDTNGKKKFANEKRALSHGCIRVQKAIELAKCLTRDDDTYITPEDLDQYLSLQQRYQIKVLKPMPLFLDYVTCEYADGRLQFYDDIYGKDLLLQENLKISQSSPVQLIAQR